VRDYNTAIKSFPDNLIAGMFNFSQRAYFASSIRSRPTARSRVLMKRVLGAVFLAFTLVLATAWPVLGLDFPSPQGYVSDFAGLLPTSKPRDAESNLAQLEKKTTTGGSRCGYRNQPEGIPSRTMLSGCSNPGNR